MIDSKIGQIEFGSITLLKLKNMPNKFSNSTKVDIITILIMSLASDKQIKSKYIERVSSNQKYIRFKPIQNSNSNSGVTTNSQQNTNLENYAQTKYNQLIREFKAKDGQNDMTSVRSTRNYEIDLTKQRINQFSSPSDNLKLDPLDEKIRIPFQSNYFPFMQRNNFKVPFEPFKDEVRDWLIDVIQITSSITINHLKAQKFNERQAKNFSSKNILLNIKEFFQKYNHIPLQHRYDLMNFINNESFRIFTKIGYKYPQNSRNGVSKRLKSQIHKIDNRQSDEFDFLFCHNINITFRQDGDYSEDIMKVINKLVSITGDVFDVNDPYQQSNYEVFTGVMEYIFDNASSQSAARTAQMLGEMIKQRKITKGDDILTEFKSAAYDDYFQNSFAREQDVKRSTSIKESTRKILFGQKIPNGTKLFSDDDIKGEFFKIHHSSILRILTKWAEELRNKFENSEEMILRRIYKFKDFHGNLLNLQIAMRAKLYEAALEQFNKVEQYLDYLKKQSTYMQTLFAEELNVGKYCKNETKVGIFASKINETSSQYMFKYINQLIHSLLTIPKIAADMVKSDRDKFNLSSVNLITLKVGDLMRCRCSTTEKEFIKILSAIEETSMKFPNILKIIRIKNRLQQQNGDLLINLFFANNMQCQLQLCVDSQVNSNEKSISTFNHYVYELTRAQLGPISQLSIIVVQYDPLISFFCKKDGYSPDLVESVIQSEKIKNKDGKLEERVRFKKKLNIGKKLQLPFVCWVCMRLSIVNNSAFFYRNPDALKRECNDCIINRLKQNQKFEQEQLEYLLKQNFPSITDQEFFRKHFYLQKYQEFVQKIVHDQQNSDGVETSNFGFLLKRNQKRPILQKYNAVYQKISSNILIGGISKSQKIKLLAKIKLPQNLKKRQEQLKRSFSSYFIFKWKNTKLAIQNNQMFLSCEQQRCCNTRISLGPYLNPQLLKNYNYIQKIEENFQNQKSTIYLNNIPNSFQKVEQALILMNDTHKRWKVTNSIRTIQAYNCNLKDIETVTNFPKLSQLNISYNPDITSLKNIGACERLKILDCKGCNLKNVDEISTLKKLQYLNLSQNSQLESIDGLSELIELKKIYLNHTKINTLKPLSKCQKLEILDVEECKYVKSISDIKSPHLNYLILVNCGLTIFDLPLQSTASLKVIEIYSEQVDNSNMLKQIKAGLNVNLMFRNNINKEINLDKILFRLASLIIVRKRSSQSSQ